jgi:hypothetical protein
MLLVIFDRPGANEDVIHVSKAEVEFPQSVVHERLKCLRCVAQANGHERKFEEAKKSDDGGLLVIAGMDRNLVVCSHQIDVGA